MSEPNNHENHADKRQNRLNRSRLEADQGREPEFVQAQLGQRMISLNALVEEISATFMAEHGSDSPELSEADTPASRLKLVLATVDYVLSVESVQVTGQEKADLISRVYSHLFGYGPLDALFLDERITTISLDGPDKAAVRYGHNELTSIGTLFHNSDHFKQVIQRLLSDAGAELREDQPYLEVGLTVAERPISINVLAPPAAFQLTADIRLHPKTLPTWEDCIASGFVTSEALQVLQALMNSSHGFLIAGEPESGKTTLLSLLSTTLPQDGKKIIAVERAGELRFPAGVERLVVRWSAGNQSGITFGEQVAHALEAQPADLILDEVRSDEPHTIAPLLQMPAAPRQIWSFRGTIFAKRLQSALGMLARRAAPTDGEALVRALYERLPFVVTVNRVGDKLRLWSIAEWQFKHSPDYPTYTPLMQVEEGQLKLTGEQPIQALDLPEDFWG